MTKLEKIGNILENHNSGAGITPRKLAALSKTSPNVARKCVSDLRQVGFDIYTNYRIVNGKRQAFYRLSA